MDERDDDRFGASRSRPPRADIPVGRQGERHRRVGQLVDDHRVPGPRRQGSARAARPRTGRGVSPTGSSTVRTSWPASRSPSITRASSGVAEPGQLVRSPGTTQARFSRRPDTRACNARSRESRRSSARRYWVDRLRLNQSERNVGRRRRRDASTWVRRDLDDRAYTVQRERYGIVRVDLYDAARIDFCAPTA